MSRCGSCGPGRGCCDFSSRAEQLPSLASIDVVETILLQACRNTAVRFSKVFNGELTEAELYEANDRLVEWLAATFCGENTHFSTAEGWNPSGLAEYLESEIGAILSERFPKKLKGDREILLGAFTCFVEQLQDLLAFIYKQNGTYEGFEQEEASARFINSWSLLLTGAPTGEIN